MKQFSATKHRKTKKKKKKNAKAKNRDKTHGVEGTLKILNSTIGKKDQEEGRAENMNISGMVFLWNFNWFIINQWRLFIHGFNSSARPN